MMSDVQLSSMLPPFRRRSVAPLCKFWKLLTKFSPHPVKRPKSRRHNTQEFNPLLLRGTISKAIVGRSSIFETSATFKYGTPSKRNTHVTFFHHRSCFHQLKARVYISSFFCFPSAVSRMPSLTCSKACDLQHALSISTVLDVAVVFVTLSVSFACQVRQCE